MSSAAVAPVPKTGARQIKSDRASVNRANARHSTGPRTESGKQRASLNALSHGLTARTAVLPTEDPVAFEQHVQQFFDEYKPVTPTEHHLVAELAGASWRLNRIPLLEAEVLTRAANPPNEQAAIDFDIVDAHRLLNSLSLHGNRLSRQFHKTLHELHQVQFQRREREVRELRDAAALLELHQQKGIPWEPADDGFVFSIEEVERYALRERRLKQARAVVQGAPYNLIPSPNPPLTASTLTACS